MIQIDSLTECVLVSNSVAGLVVYKDEATESYILL